MAYLGVCGGKAEADNILRTRVLPEALDPIAKLLHVAYKKAIEFIEKADASDTRNLPHITQLISELRKLEPSMASKTSEKDTSKSLGKLLAKRVDLSAFEDEEEQH